MSQIERHLEQSKRFDAGRFYPAREVLLQRLETHPAAAEIKKFFERNDILPDVVLGWPERSGPVLSSLGIVRHLLAGNIAINPLNLEGQMNPNTYDVTLGRFYYRRRDNIHYTERPLRPPSRPSRRRRMQTMVPLDDEETGPWTAIEEALQRKPLVVYDPLDEESVVHIWGEPQEAQTAEEVEAKYGVKLASAHPKDEVILLFPGEMILGHTEEFIGGRNVVTTIISGKSSTGRNLVEVCSDAFSGDIGFTGRWTLEIMNKGNADTTIVLHVGQPIAQITFLESQVPAEQYEGKGRYSNDPDSWTPDMMLPKMRRLKER